MSADEYVKPVLQPGDWLAVSEKFVTISQGRVIHHSVVRPGWLAKMLLVDAIISPAGTGVIYVGTSARLSYALGQEREISARAGILARDFARTRDGACQPGGGRSRFHL